MNQSSTLTKREVRKLLKANNNKMTIREIPRHVTIISYILTTILGISIIFPLLLIISVSISSQEAIMKYGYTIFPKEISFAGYQYIFSNIDQIIWSFGVTLFVTVVGTVYGMTLGFCYAYVLSQPSFPWRKQFTLFLFGTMFFSGGMLPTYLLVTQVYHLGDTIWALILPAGGAGLNVFLMRTYLKTAVPDGVADSARIDGATEAQLLVRIIVPMAVPVLGTVALFSCVGFWNDWFSGFLYIVDNYRIIPLQLLIRRIENNVTFLSNNVAAMGSGATEMQNSISKDSFKMGLVILTTLPVLISYPFFQKFFMRGLTIGSMKG